MLYQWKQKCNWNGFRFYRLECAIQNPHWRERLGGWNILTVCGWKKKKPIKCHITRHAIIFSSLVSSVWGLIDTLSVTSSCHASSPSSSVPERHRLFILMLVFPQQQRIKTGLYLCLLLQIFLRFCWNLADGENILKFYTHPCLPQATGYLPKTILLCFHHLTWPNCNFPQHSVH